MKLNDEHALDATLAALAHPIRRRILERLLRKDARITDLAEPFDVSLNAVSRHIRVLERAGLVHRRRAWREHIVSFDPAPLDVVVDWVEKNRECWEARLDAHGSSLEAGEDSIRSSR